MAKTKRKSAGAGGGGGWGGGRAEPPTKFSEGGLDRTSNFRGGDFFRGGCNFHIKNKLKSEMFNDKNL